MDEKHIKAAADRAEEHIAERDGKGRFLTAGKPGPGRPKGSRNKLGEAFIQAIYADFEEHGADAIETVRREKPEQYLKVIASVLPREVKVTTEVDLSDDELDRRIRQLAAALELEIGGEGGAGEAAGGEEAPGRTH